LAAQRCDFELVRIPPPAQLVLPDTGITQYDPNPRHDFASSGFYGSPGVQNVIHVTPISALVITRGEGRVGVVDADVEFANELNYRAYAASETYIYGPNRDSVEVVHRLAERSPDVVHERRRRPSYLWFSEQQQGQPRPAAGVYPFKGYSIDGERTTEMYVDPRATVGKPLRAEDLWE
jgi:hypothetical protein